MDSLVVLAFVAAAFSGVYGYGPYVPGKSVFTTAKLFIIVSLIRYTVQNIKSTQNSDM